MKINEYVIASNRGFIFFDAGINSYIVVKNIHYASSFHSLTEVKLAKERITKDIGCLEQDLITLKCAEAKNRGY